MLTLQLTFGGEDPVLTASGESYSMNSTPGHNAIFDIGPKSVRQPMGAQSTAEAENIANGQAYRHLNATKAPMQDVSVSYPPETQISGLVVVR